MGKEGRTEGRKRARREGGLAKGKVLKKEKEKGKK